MSLDQALDVINKDELVEVTPEHIRLRKKLLAFSQRLRSIGVEKKETATK